MSSGESRFFFKKPRQCFLIAVFSLVSTVSPSMVRAAVSESLAGTTSSGDKIQAYLLTNTRGNSVRLLSLGALIDQINVPDRRGVRSNIVVALPDLAAYESNGSFNRIIGRYANRIAGGKITLDGVDFKLATNQNGITMHGGSGAFGRKNWQGEILNTSGINAVRFSLVSPDGDGGFPGTMLVTVTYTFDDDNALRIDYFATSDKSTVVNLTNHTYFNLAGNASRDVYDHVIQVDADEFTPADERGIPTGEFTNVSGTPFDLRKPTRVGDRIASGDPQMLRTRGFDHNFVLAHAARGKPTHAIRLFDPNSGRRMDTATTEPGVQIYTANGFDGSRVNVTGTALRQSYGIALETQHFPDSPNKPNFPTTLLRANEQFRSTTIYRFLVVD